MKSHCDYIMHTSDLQKCESWTISNAEEIPMEQWARSCTAYVGAKGVKLL